MKNRILKGLLLGSITVTFFCNSSNGSDYRSMRPVSRMMKLVSTPAQHTTPVRVQPVFAPVSQPAPAQPQTAVASVLQPAPAQPQTVEELDVLLEAIKDEFDKIKSKGDLEVVKNCADIIETQIIQPQSIGNMDHVKADLLKKMHDVYGQIKEASDFNSAMEQMVLIQEVMGDLRKYIQKGEY